ncbi:hypothetical protein Rt10032_c03g1694 [Rhodotorula toruloides]|uniref:Uncharacterized protein n=1 Tax=Rhodotorula toruloides TaxID=5286 RepID=A0A511KBB9_RHOTO|nr:hypothetical protein Rt10032_c03g1694 [Rhodotorula toruloides]
MLTGKGMVPESGLEQRRTSVCLGEDIGSNRGEKRHGPDERGRFVHLPDIELRRRPGKGLIARTSKFETSQRCSDMWCRNLDGTRSRMHVVRRSDGSPDYGVLECDGRDSVAAFNLIGMGEMQRVYGEGIWRKVD